MRLNGIGTTHLGISPQDENGIATATNWFTLFYLPIFPIARLRVRFLEHQGSGYTYVVVSNEKIVVKELLRTYLFGWLLFPLMIFGPAVLTIKEVWAAVGLPKIIHIPFGVCAFIWVFVSIWKLMDWHESKCRPEKRSE